MCMWGFLSYIPAEQNVKSTQLHTHLSKPVIEVHISSTEVASQECGMSGEDSCDWQLSLSTQHQTQAGQPLMEMGHDVWCLHTLGCIL